MIRPLVICLVAFVLAGPAAAQSASKSENAWVESIKEQDGWVYIGVANAGAAVFVMDETPRGDWPIIRVWTRYEFPKDRQYDDGAVRSAMAFGQYDCRSLRQMYFADYRYPEPLLAGEMRTNEMQGGEDFVWTTPKPASDEGILTAALCDIFKPEPAG